MVKPKGFNKFLPYVNGHNLSVARCENLFALARFLNGVQPSMLDSNETISANLIYISGPASYGGIWKVAEILGWSESCDATQAIALSNAINVKYAIY